jgi:hypothetical protein
MSEPSPWGPPRSEAAPRPTAPYPTAPRPAGPRPPAPRPAYPTAQYPAPLPTAQYTTDHLPTMPIPVVRPHEQRRPAPPFRRDDYGDPDDYGDADDPDDYSDAYPDDYSDAYPDDRVSERRGGYSPDRPRTRGQVFAGLVVLLALAVSALTYVLTYQLLASVDLISEDPFGGVAGQAATLAAVGFGAIGVIVLAMIALVIARPKALAALGLAASLLLPVAALVLGLLYGGSVLRQNVGDDIAASGPAVAAQGAAAAADALVQELERRGVDAGPLRDLIVGIAGQGG